MKRLWFLLFAISVCISHLTAQQIDNYLITSQGEMNKMSEHNLSDPEAMDQVYESHGPEFKFRLKTIPSGKSQQNHDPGILPEGDYLQAAKFSPDGSMLFIVNRHTYNVTVFDTQTWDTLANIPVGYGALNIDVNNDVAVIPCYFDTTATIVDLSDFPNSYSTVSIQLSGVNPSIVKIHPNGQYAYVACATDVCDVIDLNTNAIVHTIDPFPVDQQVISWSSGSSRTYIKYNEFFFTPNGDQIVVASMGDDEVQFYNTSTNTLDGSVPIPDCRHIGLSPDGSIAFTTGESGGNDLAYRIDVATQTVLGNQVVIPDGANGHPGIISNPDGTKIYIGSNGNHGTLIDFIDEEAVTYSNTYSAFWCGASYTNEYAVHGNYNFSIINFATESVEDILPGFSQSFGAVSPTENLAVAFDPLRKECVYVYDFSTPSNINYLGAYFSGDDIKEGDAPLRVRVSPDGGKVVMANHLSESVTIFNLNTNSIDTIFTFPEDADIENVAITHNSDYAIVSFDDYNKTVIIDLTTNIIATEVNGSSGHTIRITPDDQYAYIANVAGTDKINVIRLDGASSYYVTGIITGELGVNWAHYGIFSDIRIDPAGNYCVVAVSFDDKLHIIDMGSNTIVQELPGFNFPLQLAFNSAGDKLAVTNMNGNSVSIVDFNGASSSIQGTYSCGNPRRIGYNPDSDQFYVCIHDEDKVVKVDPETGAIQETIYLNGSPVKVDFDAQGNSVILVNGDPHYIVNSSGDSYEIPYVPAHFDIKDDVTAVVSPGLDNLSVIDWSPEGGPQLISTIPADGQADVAIDATVSATFDVDIFEENLSTIAISPDPGNVAPSITGNTLTIAHDDFSYNTGYTVAIPAGSISDGTSPLADDVVWSFTTVEQPTYPVTFYVHDQYDNPLEDAEVEINGDTEITNSDGEAYFDLPEGPITYTVTYFMEVVTGNYTVTNNPNQVVDVEIIWSSIEEVGFRTEFFPNPTSAILNVNLKDNGYVGGDMAVFDIMGNELFDEIIVDTTVQLDLSNIEPGVYFIRIASDRGMIFEKVIVR